MSEFKPGVIGVCGCDSRPNPREWDVRGIPMDGSRELDGPVCVIGDVNVLGSANVDVLGPTVSVPSCNTPKYTLVVFDMFRVFCKPNLTVS